MLVLQITAVEPRVSRCSPGALPTTSRCLHGRCWAAPCSSLCSGNIPCRSSFVQWIFRLLNFQVVVRWVDEIVIVFQVLQGNMNLFLSWFPLEFKNNYDQQFHIRFLNEAKLWARLKGNLKNPFPPTLDKKLHQNKKKHSTAELKHCPALLPCTCLSFCYVFKNNADTFTLSIFVMLFIYLVLCISNSCPVQETSALLWRHLAQLCKKAGCDGRVGAGAAVVAAEQQLPLSSEQAEAAWHSGDPNLSIKLTMLTRN